ncbi:MAG: hypothetical protein L6420_11080 [Elusimicrobia bacterium]|nr:hypothetical protein [Elusimicrobiota bacterium]
MNNTDKSEPATKADINKLAQTTKADLKELEQKLNQKIDSVETKLNKKTENVFIELLKTQADVRNIKETMATKNDINRIMNAIDVFAGEAKDYRRKDADRDHMLMEQHDKLQNHENRISAIEARK